MLKMLLRQDFKGRKQPASMHLPTPPLPQKKQDNYRLHLVVSMGMQDICVIESRK